MGTDKARRQKQKRKESAFFSTPTGLLKSDRFRKLTPHAIKLLFHLASQYNGYNNGKLTLVYSELMMDWGFKSEHTVLKAKRELLEKNWIKQTAIGNRRTKAPDRFMLTFKPKDWGAEMANEAIPPLG